MEPSYRLLFTLAFVIRVLLVAYGSWQDDKRIVNVKYTDIDYVVVTDGARLVTNGESPYDRNTYRYTPLLAFLFIGNVYISTMFAKFVMIGIDLLNGYLISQILECTLSQTEGYNFSFTPPYSIPYYVSLWLFNPFVINISTRGNVESLSSFLVLLTLYCILQRKIVHASIIYGCAVHFKLYPIIYSFALLLFVGAKGGMGLYASPQFDRKNISRTDNSSGVSQTAIGKIKETQLKKSGGKRAGINVSKNSGGKRNIPEKKNVNYKNFGVVRNSCNVIGEDSSIRVGKKKKKKEKSVVGLGKDKGKIWSSESRVTHSFLKGIDNIIFFIRSRYPFLSPVLCFLNTSSLVFVILSASTFITLLVGCYLLYGWEFLYETYIHHLVRKDARHNFSVYFYHIYLSTAPLIQQPMSQSDYSNIMYSILEVVEDKIHTFLLFVPQIGLILVFTFRYYRSIVFCIFIQTLAFVALNKYFVWYFSLLPLVLPFTPLQYLRYGGTLFATWIAAQMTWLYFAYELEFLGENTYQEIFAASVFYFLVNMFIIVQFIVHDRSPDYVRLVKNPKHVKSEEFIHPVLSLMTFEGNRGKGKSTNSKK